MTIERFAEHLGAGVRTVKKWEALGSEIIPVPVLQEALDTALERASDEARARFAVLLDGEANGSRTDSKRHAEQEDAVDRRRAVKTTAMALTALLSPLDPLLERIASADGGGRVDAQLVAAHEELADTLAGLHRTVRSDVLVGPVARHADMVLGLLDCPASEADRRRLEAIVVGAHGQTGLLAFFSGARTAARRYFAIASSVAEESGDETLRAQALGVASIPYSEGIGSQTRRAVCMLSEAVEHARRSDSHTRGWLHLWLAEELTTLGDERGFQSHIEQAERLVDVGDRLNWRGFFARYAAETSADIGGSKGTGFVLLGRAREAVGAFASTPGLPGPRWKVFALTQTAAAKLIQGEPEETCAMLLQAIDLSVKAAYPGGLQRVRNVRGRMPPSWATLPCVSELDERLRTVAYIG